MATPKSQRIGIWIIVIVMMIGTIGSFAVMVLATKNSQTDQDAQNKLYEEYSRQLAEQEKRATELSDKYYSTFKNYKDSPAVFDAASVGDNVITKDIKKGTGVTITKDTKYEAYYVGWNPKGKIFDSSFNEGGLKAPLDASADGLVTGWTDGVIGMKVGGIREITIPSDLAYGEKGSGDNIPPNTPIKFIIMIIKTK
jgi:FKBP-type peptidyl-prolyl cis-trans isomerase